jgi:hypothetical protein
MLLTDYPAGMKKSVSFSTHREMDYGIAAMVATMPESPTSPNHWMAT